MATNYKVLGQAAPGATTDTDIYTVPAATEAIISTIAIANRSSTARTFRIAIRPDGAAISNEHYIAYDVEILASDTTSMTFGITMDAGDVLTVYGSTADLSFNVFGSEIS